MNIMKEDGDREDMRTDPVFVSLKMIFKDHEQ